MPSSPFVPDTISEAAQRAHVEAEARGDPGYIDPHTGLYVMTAQQHRERERCCGSGCRHCPYSPEEQRRAGRPGA